MKIRCPHCLRISEIPHVDHGRTAVCSCQATFRIDDATVTEEFSLPDLPPPETIGRYRILRYVGRGASSCVYEGTDPETGVHAAIKTLLPEYAGDKPSREQFLHAAKIYAKAVHPNIVKVFETGRNADGVPFLAMEFLSGGTLADRMTGNKHFSTREAAEIGAAVCRALAVTAELGIVHRDIKPDNIMVSADGQYKLTDLGLAKYDASAGMSSAARILDEAAQSKPSARTSFGTLEYMSPEQYIDAETCDIRSDIYSLGVTMYCLAAGRLPFEPRTRSELRHMHLSVEPVVPSTFEPEIPLDFDYIVLHCIQKDPDDRYRTPEELLADLEAFLAGKPLPSTTCGAVPVVRTIDKSLARTPKKERPWFLPAVAALLVLLILCAAGLLITMEKAKRGPRPAAPQTGPETVQEELDADEVAPGAEAILPPVRPSSKALDDAGIMIVDQEADAQISSYFEDAKQKAARALQDGVGYKSAMDDLESFTSSPEYAMEALELISGLKKASDAAVTKLMTELAGKAAPLIEAREWDGAANVYRTDIGPLAPESRTLREQKIAEIERMKRNDAPEKTEPPQKGPPQP